MSVADRLGRQTPGTTAADGRARALEPLVRVSLSPQLQTGHHGTLARVCPWNPHSKTWMFRAAARQPPGSASRPRRGRCTERSMAPPACSMCAGLEANERDRSGRHPNGRIHHRLASGSSTVQMVAIGLSRDAGTSIRWDGGPQSMQKEPVSFTPRLHSSRATSVPQRSTMAAPITPYRVLGSRPDRSAPSPGRTVPHTAQAAPAAI